MRGENLYLIFEGIIVALEIFTIYLYQSLCFIANARPNWQRLCAYAAFGIVLGFFSIFHPDMGLLPLVSLAGIFGISLLFYKGRLPTHIAVTLLFLAISIAIECLVPLTQSIVTDMDLYHLHEYGASRVAGALTAKLLTLPAVRIAALMVSRRREPFAGRMIKTVPLLVCQLLLIAILVSDFILCYQNGDRLTVSALMETIGTVFVSIVIFLYYDRIVVSYEQQYRHDIAAMQSEGQIKYYSAIKSHLDTLLALDHDIKKHTSVMENLIIAKDFQKALNYMTSFTQSVKAALSGSEGFVNTDNPIIGAILCDRIRKAEDLGVRTTIEIPRPDIIGIDDIDLTIMLGNTIDNALEALEMLPPGADRLLRINLRQSRHYLFYEIENTYCEGCKAKKSRRSFGLGNVEAVVDKYVGDFSVKTSDGLFTVTIMIGISPNTSS